MTTAAAQTTGRAGDRPGQALPPGFLPVAFDFKRGRVRLLDLRGVDCRESYFRLTAERWRREHPEAVQVDLDLEAFAAAAKLEPGRPPAGFIFPVGRCGSTLLANMLAVPHGHLVLKESDTINVLLRRLLEAEAEAERRDAETLVGLVLRFMARSEPGAERRLLLKFPSWAIYLAETLHRLFPITPAVFLYRQPGPVVASMLAQPPYDGLFEQPRSIQERFLPSLREAPGAVSRVAFYAHVWRSAAEAALALPPSRLLMLDYAELVASPQSTLAAVLAHFRLSNGPEVLSAMCAVVGAYSKDPDGHAFDPAGVHQRRALDMGQEAEVAAVVGHLPRRLADRRVDGEAMSMAL